MFSKIVRSVKIKLVYKKDNSFFKFFWKNRSFSKKRTFFKFVRMILNWSRKISFLILLSGHKGSLACRLKLSLSKILLSKSMSQVLSKNIWHEIDLLHNKEIERGNSGWWVGVVLGREDVGNNGLKTGLNIISSS